MEKIPYKLIRSKRKTLGLELRPEGLIVRAPFRATNGQIEYFVEQHRQWIRQHQEKLERQKQQAAERPALTETELKELTERARRYIPERVRYYAPKVGVDYGYITIRCQKSRWGSCSGSGHLSLSCRLGLAPRFVADYVIAHEVAHLVEMNHSDAFWRVVAGLCPVYRKAELWLKKNAAYLYSFGGGEEKQSC